MVGAEMLIRERIREGVLDPELAVYLSEGCQAVATHIAEHGTRRDPPVPAKVA